MTFDDWVVAYARKSGKVHKKVKLDDTLAFFQQLSTLVSSGTPLLQAIRLCAEQSQSSHLQQALEEAAARVAAGSALHAALAGFTQIFSFHWIEVIRTGEVTGKMDLVLLDLAKQVRDTRETRRKVVGAMMYPIILLVVAIVAVGLMLWLVVPTFANMFKEMGAKLPGITEYVISASDFIAQYGVYLLVGTVACAVAFRQYMKTESGRRIVGGMLLTLPLTGELIIQSAMYRFASTIALLLKSGTPMLETLTTLTGIFHTNPAYRDALARIQDRVASGRPLAESLEESGLFTSMITNMVRIGEESGRLAAVMEQIAPYYKEKMEGLIAKVTKLLEPVIIMGMGVTIAGMMLAIYLPMFEMAGAVH
jgi:type IV pilus assembly protein PilC